MIEEYIKMQLATKKIPMKDAAQVLGYNENSFYNKFSRHSLNIHDLIMLSMILEEKIMFVDSMDKPLYVFDYNEYLTNEDKQRLSDYMNSRSTRLDFSFWVESLPDDKKKMIFNGINRSREEMQTLCVLKRNEGTIQIESQNFTHFITVCGNNCESAAEWLEEKIKNNTPEDEILNCVACERFFDVYISYDSPTVIEVKKE